MILRPIYLLMKNDKIVGEQGEEQISKTEKLIYIK